MQPQAAGNWFVASWIAAAVAYDCLVCFGWQQPAATISDTLRSWVQFSPLVLIPLGGLLWHLFGVHRHDFSRPEAWQPVLALLAGMILYALIGIGSTPPLGPPLN